METAFGTVPRWLGIVVAVVFGLWAFVVGASNIWGVITKKTVPEVLTERGLFPMTGGGALGLANVVVSTLVLLALLANVYFYFSPHRVVHFEEKYEPTELIERQEFRNQEVLLDGKRYINCRFFNVRFKYNGTTPIQFTNNDVFGPPAIDSDSDAVKAGMGLLYVLGAIKDGVTVHVDSGTFEPLTRVPPKP